MTMFYFVRPCLTEKKLFRLKKEIFNYKSFLKLQILQKKMVGDLSVKFLCTSFDGVFFPRIKKNSNYSFVTKIFAKKLLNLNFKNVSFLTLFSFPLSLKSLVL